MAICAVAVQQPDGSYLLGLDPSVTDPATCAYVVETGGEGALGSLLSLTTDQALLIGAQIWALWALCWGIKQVARAILNPTNEGNDDA
jgi:hypothetical protein